MYLLPSLQLPRYANPDLEAARLQVKKTKTVADFFGRNTCLTEAKRYLQNVIQEGTSADKQDAIQLDATVDLETVNLWISQPDFGLLNPDFEDLEDRLLEANKRLLNVLKNGTPAENQDATQLAATLDLELVNLWVQQPNFGVHTLNPDFSILEGRFIAASKNLQNVFKNGTPTEKREATQLYATVNLEIVRLWVQQPDFGLQMLNSDLRDREKRFTAMTKRLQNVLKNGTPTEKREAIQLKARIESDSTTTG